MPAATPEASDFVNMLTPNWAALASMAVAAVLVLQLAPPALAQDIDDPELAAVQAREELAKAIEDRKAAQKEARLQERIAIRKVAQEKKQAEEVVTANVQAEVARITNEKVITEQLLTEKVRVAREIAIRANQMADTMSEEKRKAKVLQVDNLGPAKKELTKALAEKAIADEDAAYRRQFAEKAVALQQKADSEASDMKAELEKAVVGMAAQ